MERLGEGVRMENNMKRNILVLIVFGLLAQTALADGSNPFLSEKAVKPKKEVQKKEPQPQPMAPIPPPPMFMQQQPLQRVEVPEKVTTWRIAGKVGDLVPLINLTSSEKVIVQNGMEKDGCLVLWPDIICNREEKAAAQRKLTEAANAKKAEESALAAQTAKVAELQKSLTATAEEAGKLKAQVASLKSVVETPVWVKGKVKEYQDPVLGKAKVFADGDKVYFQVEQKLETSADSFFGPNALKKERKGDFTYYALNAKSVRVRE